MDRYCTPLASGAHALLPPSLTIPTTVHLDAAGDRIYPNNATGTSIFTSDKRMREKFVQHWHKDKRRLLSKMLRSCSEITITKLTTDSRYQALRDAQDFIGTLHLQWN